MKEARFYENLDGKVRCRLCNHYCIIKDGKRGICGVRENRDGRLFSLVYGRSIATGVEPIEKKPFFHFYPGTTAYSIATVGCNFHCLNCQNWEISQMPKTGEGGIIGKKLLPEEIVANAKRLGCKSIAYTYTEPTIFFEYAYDTARLAHKEGIKNVFVTNGYTSGEAIKEIAPFLDAANVDLKSFDEDFYRKICGAKLQPVLDNIRLYRELAIWVEVTTLIIPGYSDDKKQLRAIAEFIKGIGEDIPWHITAFYPAYKLPDVPPTTIESLRRAREIGIKAGLKYVYEGNVPGEGGENTYCYHCGEAVITRYRFEIRENKLTEGKCPKCKNQIDGVGF
ncbi:Pyruvate formate-lyase 1-activating enzyme [Candidatus Brocadiaceae bacterium B188]|nr:AmmeMemoRadiSam system radical SAM enzyme [Candidatus Brocadia sapporoensis]RZV57109.1 MAG: AmmeMemoRadiSam system radical SAM enzyme [Candidatus Brocadia sp. BROELEC01]TWU52109.1 Pyruvate formate-lyase 1-activating enzyme [Candidatus Brocadiaceae bacterium B188]